MGARRRIEGFFLSSAGSVVGEIADGETERLAEALGDLEERRAHVVAAEAALRSSSGA